MKRIIALLLACGILFGSTSFAETALSPVCSYDYSLRFHLESGYFPFRDRAHMKGYSDLLEMLNLKGNISWCPDNGSADLMVECVPVTNPSASVSARIYGLPNRMRVSSSLLGKETVWFNPLGFLSYAKRAWEALQIPLIYPLLLYPDITRYALQTMLDTWNEEIGEIRGTVTVSNETVLRIAEAWKTQMVTPGPLLNWIASITYPITDSTEMTENFHQLPDMLVLLAGGQDLIFESDGENLRGRTADGFVFYDEFRSATLFRLSLTFPENAGTAVPSVSFWWNETDGAGSASLSLFWGNPSTRSASESVIPASDGANVSAAAVNSLADETNPVQEAVAPVSAAPDPFLDLRLKINGLPLDFPSDAEIAGSLQLEGTLFPNIQLLLNGKTTANGDVDLSLLLPDRQEKGPVFSCTGSVTKAVREEPLAYTAEDLKAKYNLLNLNDESMSALVSGVDRPLVIGLINFLYELPASACQSVMDDLEDYGIIRTLLRQ